MALKMTNREVDGVAVVALDGRIVLGEESNALREKVKSLIAAGKKKIVLNMDNTIFLDRKSTRLNSSHTVISYAVFCLKKKKYNNVLSIYRTETIHNEN